MLTIEQAALFDPFCPPNWRWERAVQLAEKATQRLNGVNDPAIPPAVEFILAKEKKSRRKATAVDHALEKAFALHQEDSPLQWEVRARLVAGQSDDEIAARCRLQSSVVKWYADLFYDVRPRLKAMDWMVRMVLGFRGTAGFQKHDVGPYWALLALSGGSIVLDHFVDLFHRAWRPGEPPTLAVYLCKEVPLDAQGDIALRLLPPEADAWFHEFHLRLMEAEAVADPVLLAKAKDDILRETVGLAQLVLEGKPLPEPPTRKVSQRSPLTTRDRSREQTSGQSAAGTPDVAVGMVDFLPSGEP